MNLEEAVHIPAGTIVKVQAELMKLGSPRDVLPAALLILIGHLLDAGASKEEIKRNLCLAVDGF